MISFRYHVVTIVGVLLALAAGVVLGNGPLQDDGKDASGSGGTVALAQANRTITAQESALSFDDSYATATSGAVLGRQLTGRAVTLVNFPGADEGSAARVVDAIAQAGGEVTAQVAFSPKLLDVANRQLVGELATQLQQGTAGRVEIPAGASGYERLGLLLATAITSSTPRGDPVGPGGESILAGLATADLVTTKGNLNRRGNLVVFVIGPPAGSADQRMGAGSITATLASAIDSVSGGVVVSGPMSSSAEDGIIGIMLEDPTAAQTVSTVDVVDRAAGAVVTALALAGQAAGQVGHYGGENAPDGPVPGSG